MKNTRSDNSGHTKHRTKEVLLFAARKTCQNICVFVVVKIFIDDSLCLLFYHISIYLFVIQNNSVKSKQILAD